MNGTLRTVLSLGFLALLVIGSGECGAPLARNGAPATAAPAGRHPAPGVALPQRLRPSTPAGLPPATTPVSSTLTPLWDAAGTASALMQPYAPRMASLPVPPAWTPAPTPLSTFPTIAVTPTLAELPFISITFTLQRRELSAGRLTIAQSDSGFIEVRSHPR